MATLLDQAGRTTVGATLTAAREAAGRTVEDVSAATCIRPAVLRDLEADRLETCGGAVYARGHVKAVCALLGIDPLPLLAMLDGASQHPGEVRLPKAAPPERRGPNWKAAAALAVVVLLGLLVVGVVTEPRGTPLADELVLAAPLAPVTQPAPKPVAKPAPVRPPATLEVRLRGGSSWVSVRSGKRLLFEGVLTAGAFRAFRDPAPLRLVIGNAGAVHVVCGGRDTGVAGRVGAVLRFDCARGGLVRA